MEKIRKKHLKLLLFICMLSATAFSQSKTGLQNYNFLGRGKEYVWMPVFHYQATKGFYAELRYNYEDVQTLSLFAGKTFTGRNDLEWAITPMVGFSTGKFTGASLAVNAEAEWKDFYFSTQAQFSRSTESATDNFFFNWSEGGYNLSENFFGGIAVQFTGMQNGCELEPGFVAGLNLKNLSVPVYIFNPFKQGTYFVLGLNYSFDLKRNIKRVQQ
ncbi:MAG: hypothetical protein ABI688_06765 [Bacteroidota bacterium]